MVPNVIYHPQNSIEFCVQLRKTNRKARIACEVKSTTHFAFYLRQNICQCIAAEFTLLRGFLCSSESLNYLGRKKCTAASDWHLVKQCLI
jgi:hypothetical protein